MKIVISGATSFIGRPLVIRLANDKNSIIALGRNLGKLEFFTKIDKITTYICDMSHFEEVGMDTGRCDCYVHLAWDGTHSAYATDKDKQEENFINSLAGVKSIIEAGCKKVVLIGSQAEYGRHENIITEEAECNPFNEYGKAKYKLFRAASELCRRNHVTLIECRLFSVYGPNDFKNSMIMATLKKMLNNEKCDFSEATQMWDYVYIDDAVEAIARICSMDCKPGVYNVAGGDIRRLREYIEEMAAVAKSESKLQFGTIQKPSSGLMSIQPDITKIKGTTGWNPKTSFADGIGSIIRDWQLGR